MTYDDKYDTMPLRGKISVNAWARDHNECGWGETSRRYQRKLCRHNDPYTDWMLRPMYAKWVYKGPYVTKGKKPKTWKDYN